MQREVITNSGVMKRSEFKKMIEKAGFKLLRASTDEKHRERHYIYGTPEESLMLLETEDNKFAIYRPVAPDKMAEFIEEMKGRAK
jgi:hypothetical protein